MEETAFCAYMLGPHADADETRGYVLDAGDTDEGSHLPGRFDGAGVVEDPFETLVGVDLK
jgi:hypothetical protein